MTREQAESLRLDDKNWTLGIIYICKDDPRFIVRNRWKFGWAWNFGNWKTLIILPIFIAIFLAPILIIAPLYGITTNIVIVITLVILLVLVLIANYVANGPR